MTSTKKLLVNLSAIVLWGVFIKLFFPGEDNQWVRIGLFVLGAIIWTKFEKHIFKFIEK